MTEKIQSTKLNCYWIYIGVTLLTVGVCTLIFWPTTFRSILHSQRILDPNSPFLSNWIKTPVPLTFNIYFWNWTNPEDINNPSIKPKFQEVGPISYQITKEKVQIVWNDNNNTVSYKLVKKYFFDEENSGASLNDSITTIDSVARSVAYLARKWGYIAKKGVSISLMNLAPKIAVTKQADEFLFRGHDNVIMDIARKTAFATGIQPPDMDKFGYFYGRNNTPDIEGEFNMATGKGEHESGDLLRWRFKNHSGYYPDKCGEIRGALAGELLPVGLTKDYLSVFSSEQGRNFMVDYQKEAEIEGIKGYKYSGGPGIMDNGTNIPENECYCMGECMPSGSINASLMVPGVPMFMTFPHFYNADPYYASTIEGMNPDPNKHELFVIAEPTTGIPLKGALRIQVNILLDPDEHITLFRKVPRTLIPIFWLEEKATITQSLAHTLETALHIYKLVNILGILFIIIGFVCISMGLFHPANRILQKLLHINKDLIQEKENVPLKTIEED